MTALPNWLRSVDNGRIGEARTRSILIDRFWILERNVDIEGADFIIQRKIWGRNLLDERAPRLGYVQSKFFQNESTSLRIPSDYVLDGENRAREEFFLFVHSGGADAAESFFFGAKEIIETFGKDSECFRIETGALRTHPEARIHSTDHILSLMESALAKADFLKNRQFLHYLQRNDVEEAPIDYDYSLPLANWWGNMTEGVKALRSRTISLITNLEHDTRTLRKALDNTDPIDLIETFRFEHFYFLEDYFYRNPKFFDEEFYNVLIRHKKRVDLLRTRGLLQQFLALKSQVESRIREEYAKSSTTSSHYSCIDVQIRESSLSLVQVRICSRDRSQVVPAKPTGIQEFCGVTWAADIYTLYARDVDVRAGGRQLENTVQHLMDEFDEQVLLHVFGEAELNGT